MKLNLSSGVRTMKSVITANSPVLLATAAIAGVITTGVLAAKGGYKARGIVDEERARRVAAPEAPFDTYLEYKEAFEKNAPQLAPVEIAKLTWLCYAVPAVTGASTIASVLGVHLIHTKRHAALAGLYVAATGKLDDYREEAEKLLGPKKSQELTNVIGQKAVDASADEFVNNEIIITPGGDQLCYDEYGGRWFLGSLPAIEKAFVETNLQLAKYGEASVNEFYDSLGLQPTQVGHHGWAGGEVSGRFGTVTTPDGRSAISFSFHEIPKDLGKLR